MKFFRFEMLLILAFVVGFCSCKKEENVIAKIGNETITTDSFSERMLSTPPAYQAYLSTQQGKKQFADLMVREKLILESAKQAGVNNRQEYKQAISEFKKEQARQLKDYEDGIMVEMYLKDLQANSLSVSEDEVNKYYEENKQDFDKPVAIVARHILVPTKEEAELALERIKKGEKFEDVAKELSTDKISAEKGGLIGPFRKGELVKEFEDVVFSLNNGEISEIVESPYGMHIITKVTEEPLAPIPEDIAKNEIKKILEKNKFEKWFEDAKQKFNVQVDYSKLENVQETNIEDIVSVQDQEIEVSE